MIPRSDYESQDCVTEGKLKNYRVLMAEYEILQDKLYKLYKKAYKNSTGGKRLDNVTAAYGDDPRPANRRPVLWFAEALKLLENESQGLIEKMDGISRQLDKYDGLLIKAGLTPTESTYAQNRYFEGLSHGDIALAMDYSKRGADAIRVRVLDKFSRVSIK